MKRMMAIVLLAAILLVTACAPALAEYKVYKTEESNRETQKYPRLKRGDTGSRVRELQWRLVELGYLDACDVDGVYGKVTESAVYCFQVNNWLTGSDGLAYAYTQYKLHSEFAVPIWGFEMSECSYGDYGFDVSRLQRRLCDTGYLYDYQVTGFYGLDTENAVKKFQVLNCMYDDGIADEEVLRSLFSYNMHSFPQ